jgi:hypothetical protein
VKFSHFRKLLFLFTMCAAAGAFSLRAATTNFVEGFETGLTNWIVGDGNPTGTTAYWGVVDSALGGEGTHTGNFKAYCAGIGYSGTSASPTYQNYMTAYLTRTIDLTGYTNASLSFWYKTPGIELTYDFARVLVGNTELWLTDIVQTNWTMVSLSLEQFIGSTQTLTFQFLSDSSVTREGWYLDDITLSDAFTPAPPPTNDNFSAAQLVVGSVGSVGATTRGATAETNELDPGNSIWFRWTPYTNGVVTFRTGGSAIDTLLCVYRGNSLTNLVRIACDDNGDTNGGSRVSFTAAIGTNYYFSARGVSNAPGFVLLSWEQPNGLGQPLLPDLFVWTNAGASYLYGWYLDQNEGTQPGRVLLRASTATPNIGAGALELRGSSTTPGVYQRVFRADGSYYERFAGNFTFHPGHGHLHFDNWINLHLRAVLTNNGVGDIVASGDKTSFAIIDLTRYDASLPGSPGSAQYGGGLIQGLSVGWADVYSANLQDQWIDVTDVPSGRYWLEGIVDPANSILEANESNNLARILINLTVPSTVAPRNDHFSNSIVIAAVTGGDLGHNFYATRETGEPTHVNASATNSAWWQWTAPSNMTAKISTDGSDFNTTLAVYTGGAVSNLTSIASDNDTGIGNNSLVTFSATGGVPYRIAVAGYGGTNGFVQLNINPAFNDAFANCLVITGKTGSVSGSTRGATRQTGEPNHAGVSGGSGSIWYCWTAPTNGPFTFDTSGSSFDTLLGIYTGAAVNALALIASDNNSGSNNASRVTFNAVSNTLYRIAIDGVAGATGVVKLAWSGPLPPSVITPPASTNAVAGSTVIFSVLAGGASPLAYQWRREGTNLVNNEYISGAQSASITLNKIFPGDAGVYTVVITNAYGTVTSAPANLIVLDNPRVVFIDEVSGHSGAFVRVPIEIQSVGNEHSVAFTLLFDPAILSNPRATNVPAGAAITLNTNQIASGALGVSLVLPGTATFNAGDASVIDFVFNTAASPATTQTFAGFGAMPTARAVKDTNGATLTTLFVAGTIDLQPLRVSSSSISNGTYRLTFSSGAGNRYAIDASMNLSNWTALVTNAAAGSVITFATNAALPHQFFRVRLVP